MTKGRILELKPQKDGTDYKVIGDYNEPGTRIEVVFPKLDSLNNDVLEWGQLAIQLSKGDSYNGPSSPYWYDEQSFYVLINSIDPKGEKLINILKSIFGLKCGIKELHLDENTKKMLKSRSSLNFSEENAINRKIHLTPFRHLKLTP